MKGEVTDCTRAGNTETDKQTLRARQRDLNILIRITTKTTLDII